MKRIQFSGIIETASLLTLAGLLGCSGGNSPNPEPPSMLIATSLSYTDPAGTGYRFVRDASLSTSDKLVLALRGPEQGTGRGVSFGVSADTTKAAFVKINATDVELAQNASFNLGVTEPKLFKCVTNGDTLKVSIAQKGTTAPAQPLSGTLARVALQLQPNVIKNTNIALSVTADARILPSSGNSQPMTIAVGTLVAR